MKKKVSFGSFPIGKVDFLEIDPMSFGEFLSSPDEDARRNAVEQGRGELVNLLHEAYISQLKSYLFIEAMPENINTYRETHSYHRIRRMQNAILTAYDKDFEKHASQKLLAKLRLSRNNIPSQLTKENKKILYSISREGARARKYEKALQWMDDAAIVRVMRRGDTPRLPLKAYEDFSAFKLFIVVVGLLGALSKLKPETLLDDSSIFTNFTAALTVQYVLQEFCALGFKSRYWTSDIVTDEIDFVIPCGNHVFPMEVKARRNLKARRLSVYREHFAPNCIYRASHKRYQPEGAVKDYPLYALPALV